MIATCPEPAALASPRSSSACPATNRSDAAAFNAGNSCPSYAEPTWSMLRDPPRDDHTMCTAAAPDAVFTVRTHATPQPTATARCTNQPNNTDKTPGQATVTPATTESSAKSADRRLVGAPWFAKIRRWSPVVLASGAAGSLLAFVVVVPAKTLVL